MLRQSEKHHILRQFINITQQRLFFRNVHTLGRSGKTSNCKIKVTGEDIVQRYV